MKRAFKNLLTRFSREQRGFTLIEMILAVGIIVVLAAVVAPNIGRFIEFGGHGAKNSEQVSIEAARFAMMSENGVASVTPLAGNSTNGWSELPAGGARVRHLHDSADANYQYRQAASSSYFYGYDALRKITRQDEVATAC